MWPSSIIVTQRAPCCVAFLVFVLQHYKGLKMRMEQSVGSCPRRTVTADISPRSEDFSGSVIVRLAVCLDNAVDTDRSCSRRSF